MLTSKSSKTSVHNGNYLESDQGSNDNDSEATISETSTEITPKSSNIIDSEFPAPVDSAICNNLSVSTNSAINVDIDSSTDDGSKRFADVVATATIINGLMCDYSLRDAKCLLVLGDA